MVRVGADLMNLFFIFRSIASLFSFSLQVIICARVRETSSRLISPLKSSSCLVNDCVSSRFTMLKP